MSFKNDFWTMIAQEMETHTMKGSRKSARARKDKWNKLKADFKNISYLKLASGFTYSEKKDVDVNKASQVVWDNAVQDVMPEHATGAHAFWASQSVVGGTVSNEENDGEIEGDSDEEAAMNVNTTGKDSPATVCTNEVTIVPIHTSNQSIKSITARPPISSASNISGGKRRFMLVEGFAMAESVVTGTSRSESARLSGAATLNGLKE
ncbi:hypothetical protein SERLADRAFT_416304 [Serpula lacrymans var. lacrymans S7.9]|uniref:Myb/SANT-like domain-containing protein n=1 Tax=Serpula lacrymans var. lacrymans (strain S7.9) TaxID=578457 RepID=F8P028_SERL9|nr:uncharacterized protein SERLADRAFT_416304 [Serpula lacrymans var. lacrymans S7.9]EGO24095.1 hypothetical protein SERLADRAFT_416304 [Serpula lacrymans var. lacrymans S7.9]